MLCFGVIFLNIVCDETAEGLLTAGLVLLYYVKDKQHLIL